MAYKGQLNLITPIAHKDPNLYNFLKNTDKGLTEQALATASSASVKIIDQLITSSTTISYPNPSGGQILVVFIQQDGIGHVITWGSNFVNPPTIDTTAGTYSVAIFLGRANNTWILMALPILGMLL